MVSLLTPTMRARSSWVRSYLALNSFILVLSFKAPRPSYCSTTAARHKILRTQALLK
jgi:hypothetical protein